MVDNNSKEKVKEEMRMRIATTKVVLDKVVDNRKKNLRQQRMCRGQEEIVSACVRNSIQVSVTRHPFDV